MRKILAFVSLLALTSGAIAQTPAPFDPGSAPTKQVMGYYIAVRPANDIGLRLAWVIAYSHRHRDMGRVYSLRTESKRRITAIT